MEGPLKGGIQLELDVSPSGRGFEEVSPATRFAAQGPPPERVGSGRLGPAGRSQYRGWNQGSGIALIIQFLAPVAGLEMVWFFGLLISSASRFPCG